jgi:predicted component of type VI protein secretion system
LITETTQFAEKTRFFFFRARKHEKLLSLPRAANGGLHNQIPAVRFRRETRAVRNEEQREKAPHALRVETPKIQLLKGQQVSTEDHSAVLCEFEKVATSSQLLQ